MTLARTEVCGIPAFLAEAPGSVSAGLIFRVGTCDEPLPVRGITHLCEHLALSDLIHEREHAFNGFVTPNLTHFVVQGSTDQVVQHLSEVAHALSHLPTARFQKETAILLAEAAGQPTGVLELLLKRRYGARGYGRVAFAEHGLRRLTVDEVTAWAAQRFGASVASLWIAGPDPEDVARRCEVELLPGERLALPSLDPVFRPPGRAELNVAGPSLGVVGGRSGSFIAAIEILHQRLQRDARHEQALAYSIATSYTTLNAEVAHAHVGFDAQPDDRAEAVSAMYRVLAGYADGPTSDEVERHLRLLQADREDPLYSARMAHHFAMEILLGGKTEIDELERSRFDVDVESIRDAFAASMTSALLVSPHGIEVPDNRFYLLSELSRHEVEGRAFVPVGKKPGPQRVIVGDGGVTLRFVPGKHLTVRADSCEVLAHWDDGSRAMVGSDGFSLLLEPWEWQEGDELVAAIDATIGPELRVPMGEGDGPPADADRARRRWRVKKRR